MKKLIIFFCLLFVIFVVMFNTSCATNSHKKAATSMSSSDVVDSNEINENDFITTDYEDGVAVIDYTGESENVVIPETINGKKVLKLGGHFIKDDNEIKFNWGNFESVKLPSTLKYIEKGCFHSTYMDKLSYIYVNETNPYFTSVDGILYNKSKSELLAIPADYKEKTIDICDGTKVAYELLSNNCADIKIPATLEKIDINCDYPAWFYDSDYIYNSTLKAFDVSEENKYFSSDNGVLYNKDKTELLIYPFAKSDKVFTVPDSVTTIAYFDLQSIPKLTTIVFNENIKTINLYTDFDYDCAESLAPQKIKVKGYKGTVAESWAKEQSETLDDKSLLTFEEIE